MTTRPDADQPGGRGEANSVATSVGRDVLRTTGTVVCAGPEAVGRAASWRVTLDDGTGLVDLVFVGRPVVAGLSEGARVAVVGTARKSGRRLVVWNPAYTLEAPPA